MSKPHSLFFQQIKNSWQIHQDLGELFSIPHDRYDERIEKLEAIITKLKNCPENTATQNTIEKFETMLQTSREEQVEAAEKANLNNSLEP